MTVLHDPVRPFDPSSQRELLEPEQEADARGERSEPLGDLGDRSFPRSSKPKPPREPADGVRAALQARGPRGKTSFESASRGEYTRTETGTDAG
jgi:hypothetical protein